MSRESRRRKRVARRVRTRVSPWPAGEQANLLAAALLSGPAALDAWRAWRAAADLDRLDQASFRLVPLLARNLDRQRVEDDWTPRLRGIHRRAWCANQVLFRRLSTVLATLGSAGIRTMVLKGAALAEQAYGDLGARPMSDLDVLVPTADFPRALGVLAGAGWITSPAWIAECAADPVRFRSRQHAVGMRTAGDAGSVLDLHQDVFRVYRQYQVPVPESRLWDASEPCEFHGVATRRLAPHHLLLHVCFHGLQSQVSAPLRWIPDADRLIRARERDLDWRALLADARDLQIVDVLREALPYLAATFGTPVPAHVLDAVRGEPVALVERLERPLRRGDDGIAAEYCASLAPLLRHARRPGAGFLRSLGAGHLMRVTFGIPWEHAVHGPWRRLRHRARGPRSAADPGGAPGQPSPLPD